MKVVTWITALATAVIVMVVAHGQMREARTSSDPAVLAKMSLPAIKEQRFALLSTELSPAAVAQCKGREISFLKNMSYWGLGAPTYAAVPTGGGVRIIRRGDKAPKMNEAWMLCWFNGAQGWNEWDAPVLVVLQHKPSSIDLSSDGLSFSFPKEAGLITFMPLYGFTKIPLTSKADYGLKHNLPGVKQATDNWKRGLPGPVVTRCRHFTRILRMIPVYCREEFAVDGDDLLVRSKFTWLPIADDWKTPPLKFAPIPPVMGLAWWAGKHGAGHPFPMKFSQAPSDPDFSTAFGPYMGMENADGYTVRMSVLKYVNLIGKPGRPDFAAHPSAAKVSKRLEDTLSWKFNPGEWQQRMWDHGGQENYCWQVMGDRWYAKAIPYLPSDTKINAKLALHSYLRDVVLNGDNYKSYKNMLILEGPGIGTWGGFDDAGKFSSNVLETVWDIAYYTESFDVVKERWPVVKKLFITPLECDWKSVGRFSIAELGDEAAPALSMARLAYKVGDKDTYAFASYVFAGELVHHYVKQVGAPYFRLHQPWTSEEYMPNEVYLTNLWADVAGWRIDGPTYPREMRDKQYSNRWVRFSSEDVAAFYRDYLPDEVRLEMDLLTSRARAKDTIYKIGTDTAHIAPSMVRLRALLLNEPPEKLASLASPDTWDVSRPADVTAMCVPFLRNASPVERVRLIPPTKTDFALGLERTGKSDSPALSMVAEASGESKVPRPLRDYPFLRWHWWRAPASADGFKEGKWWSFGQVVPGSIAPSGVQGRRLNWNTQVWLVGG